MKNKLIAALLVLALAITQLGVFAFDDMAEERLSWAVEAVEKMAEKGIIKGYEDGTFRPDNEITKEEALILMSRIYGFADESSEKYKSLATEIYGEFISGKYNTPYVNEISYLIYCGVIKSSELDVYIADDVRTEPLKRHEAAILITKLMGAEGELVNSKLAYDDQASIPTASKPYVAYVTDNELMNGMGENRFEPMISLTRAQVATLLYRAMNKLDFSYVTGILNEYNPANDIAVVTVGEKQEQYEVTSETPVALDGNYTKIADVPEEAEIRLTFSGEEIIFIDATTPEYKTTLNLVFVKYEKFTDATVVTFKEVDSDEEVRVPLGEIVVVTRNGVKKDIAVLVAGDLVTVDIVGEKIARIDAESALKENEGVIVAMHFAANFTLAVNTDGIVTDYKVYDNVKVVRNGKVAELSDLRIGDTVILETKYNVIEKITATSKTRTTTGIVTKILISSDPTITVSEDGIEKEYALLDSVKVIRDGENADVYALRLGDTAKVTVESETVVKIEVVPAEEAINYTGKILHINTVYGYIMIDGISERIIIDDAKIQDSTGKTLTEKDIKVGSAITVFGTKQLGTVDANLIIVNK